MKVSYLGALIVTILVLISSVSAEAQSDYFRFTYANADLTASGSLTTNPLSGGSYQVTGISGISNGSAITGLDSGYEGPDNELFPTTPYLDYNGLSYDTATNATNIFWDNVHYSEIINSQGGSVGGGVFTLTQVPAPGSLPTFAGLGLSCFSLLRRRRRTTRPTHSAD